MSVRDAANERAAALFVSWPGLTLTITHNYVRRQGPSTIVQRRGWRAKARHPRLAAENSEQRIPNGGASDRAHTGCGGSHSESWMAGLRRPRVRPRGRFVSTVQVRAWVGRSPETERNCVTARWGGEQQEVNRQSVG